MRIFALGLLLLLPVAGCKQQNSPDNIATELRERLLPEGGDSTKPLPLARNGISVSTEWDISSPLTRSDFESWLGRRLQPDFVKVQDANNPLIFSKHFGGETQRLEIRLFDGTDNKAGAHVRFVVMPD